MPNLENINPEELEDLAYLMGAFSSLSDGCFSPYCWTLLSCDGVSSDEVEPLALHLVGSAGLDNPIVINREKLVDLCVWVVVRGEYSGVSLDATFSFPTSKSDGVPKVQIVRSGSNYSFPPSSP